MKKVFLFGLILVLMFVLVAVMAYAISPSGKATGTWANIKNDTSAAKAAPAKKSVIMVPGDYATIQAAVNAAASGDTIKVVAGEYAGAVVNKRVKLMGSDGATVIKNLPGTPTLPSRPYLPIGFSLVAGADGASIAHFIFDGTDFAAELKKTWPKAPAALAFGVYAKSVNDVSVQHNTVLGTIQGINNWYGDNWVISHNTVVDQGYWNGGGIGILVGSPMLSQGTPVSGNEVSYNDITGTIATDFNGSYSMAGICLFGTQGTVIQNNKVTFLNQCPTPDLAIGINVTSVATLGRVWPLCVDTTVVNNDCRNSEIGLLVDENNSQGLYARGNFGRNVIVDLDVDDAVKNRSKTSVYEGN